MTSLSAADLQRKLEGAPDPFPSFTPEPTSTQNVKRPAPASLDTDSEHAFPALAASTAANPKASGAASAWRTAPRVKPVPLRSTGITDSFTLDAVDLSSTARDGGRAQTLAEVLKSVSTKYKVKLEASSQRKTGQTTFMLKGEVDKDVEKAKRTLIALLSPQVTIQIPAPVSTIASIIGPKGAFLKQLRDETGVRVDIPRRDAAPTTNGHHRPSQASTRDASPFPDEEEEETVPITIVGSAVYVKQAKDHIEGVIATKISKTTQRIRDIPAHVIPFILSRKAEFEGLAPTGHVSLTVHDKEREIIASGDRPAVSEILDAIRAGIEDLKSSLMSIKMPLPKSQHRLLSGKAAEDIINKAKCAVVLPGDDAQEDEIILWAKAMDLPGGLAQVQQAANSQHVHSFVLPGDAAHAKQIFTYLTRNASIRALTASHPGVSIYPPSAAHALKSDKIIIDFLGDAKLVQAARAQFSDLIGKLNDATRDIEIDWLLHRAISGKFAKKLKQLQEAHRVLIFFPSEGTEISKVLLVHDPLSPPISSQEKAKHLEQVEAELVNFSRELADVKTEVLHVEPKWHHAVLGRGGTTLNAIIGEDSTLSIKLGADASKLLPADSLDADVIVIRGAAADVARATEEINRVVENAKTNEIDNGYVIDFVVPRDYVGRIVGSHGAVINKLRDQLGVEVDFSDEVEDKDKDGNKKKKTTSTSRSSKVKVRGRKENVEEAKKRIMSQVDKLADETSEVLKIPRQYHSSLIGRNAKYVMRLEEKYVVKITFPRESDETGESKTREVLKSDEVLVKGGKKGVAEAKKELLDAVEFEKESNNSVKFTVPNRSVARILGKGGVVVNEIKDSTGAQIDIDKATDDSGSVTNVTVRGTKQAIADAKVAIMRIADEVDDEVEFNLTIESRFHRTIIGARGQGLRDLIVKCGGGADPRSQAGLVHFPRPGESSDNVHLHGPRVLVTKLKAELETFAASLRDRVVLGAAIPASQHRALIGRNGQTLTNLQEKLGVQVQFPGSRSYQQVGELVNAAEMADVDPQDLVKVMGPRAACEQAIQEMVGQTKTTSTPAHHREAAVDATVEVPAKYQHAISQNGNFFRLLRSFGVNVQQSIPASQFVPSSSAVAPSSARIDDPDSESATEVHWQIMQNYDGADESISVWTLKARDQGGIDRAQKAIEHAIERARHATHVGLMTVADKSAFPRVVGSKGATVARLREETGAEINVGREDNTITIIGSEQGVLAAKDAVMQVVSSHGRSRQ